MSDNSMIEGCVRQSTNNPLATTRVYMDDHMIIMSSCESDHEFMRRKIKYSHESETIQPRGEEITQAHDRAV